MSLIPSITIEELKSKLNGNGSIKRLKCCELIDEKGEYVATLIVPCMDGGASIFDHTKTQAEYLGMQGNSVYQEVTKIGEDEVNPLACTICGRPCASQFGLQSHMRKHK